MGRMYGGPQGDARDGPNYNKGGGGGGGNGFAAHHSHHRGFNGNGGKGGVSAHNGGGGGGGGNGPPHPHHRGMHGEKGGKGGKFAGKGGWNGKGFAGWNRGFHGGHHHGQPPPPPLQQQSQGGGGGGGGGGSPHGPHRGHGAPPQSVPTASAATANNRYFHAHHPATPTSAGPVPPPPPPLASAHQMCSSSSSVNSPLDSVSGGGGSIYIPAESGDEGGGFADAAADGSCTYEPALSTVSEENKRSDAEHGDSDHSCGEDAAALRRRLHTPPPQGGGYRRGYAPQQQQQYPQQMMHTSPLGIPGMNGTPCSASCGGDECQVLSMSRGFLSGLSSYGMDLDEAAGHEDDTAADADAGTFAMTDAEVDVLLTNLREGRAKTVDYRSGVVRTPTHTPAPGSFTPASSSLHEGCGCTPTVSPCSTPGYRGVATAVGAPPAAGGPPPPTVVVARHQPRNQKKAAAAAAAAAGASSAGAAAPAAAGGAREYTPVHRPMEALVGDEGVVPGTPDAERPALNPNAVEWTPGAGGLAVSGEDEAAYYALDGPAAGGMALDAGVGMDEASPERYYDEQAALQYGDSVEAAQYGEAAEYQEGMMAEGEAGQYAY